MQPVSPPEVGLRCDLGRPVSTGIGGAPADGLDSELDDVEHVGGE